MNKKIIWIITIFLALAMMGLIIVQSYWVKNALQIKEQQFKRIINESLSIITREIEEQETIFYISNYLDITSSAYEEKKTEKISNYSQPFTIKNDSFFQLPSSKNINTKTSAGNIDATSDYETNLLRLIENKASLIEDIIDKMSRVDINIEDRISQESLQEIINNTLKEKGIKLTYEFALLDNSSTIIYKSTGFEKDYPNHIFQTKLFPNDLSNTSFYMTIYFPDEMNYLFFSLGTMVLTSISLTILILILFTLTTFIIIKQKKVSEIKNDFINNMTHELKTPISTISLATQMLKDKSLSPEKKNLDYVSGIIDDETKRLSYHVEKVLQMAIFEKGKIKLKYKDIDIHELINKVVKSFSIQAKNKNGVIIQHLQSKHPLVHADELHFTNILSNLIDNALKYSREDPEIIVSTSDQNKKLCISVKDNGIGISKENRSKIFDRFYRVPTGNIHNVKGFGLGLTYVRKMVDAHGGRILVTSEPQKGSNFQIYLPLDYKTKS